MVQLYVFMTWTRQEVPTIKLFLVRWIDRWVMLKLLNVSLSVFSQINFEHIHRGIIDKLNHP